MIVAGLGCRKGGACADVLSAIEAALAEAGRGLVELSALYIPEFKRDEAALLEAARELGKPLHTLSRSVLELAASHTLTDSARVQAELGLPSVAECAALAGADRAGRAGRARLLAPRSAVGGATCALAELLAEAHAGEDSHAMDAP